MAPKKPQRRQSDGRPPPGISEADAALFRDAVGPVATVTHDLAELRQVLPSPVPVQTRRDERAAMRAVMDLPLPELALELADPLSHAAHGVDPRLLKRLGRGEYSVTADLDLHGMSQAQAEHAIARFLDMHRREHRLCVRIVHGRGLNSKHAVPVLKGLTDRVLRRRGDVLAYRTARPADGGAGAVIVLLRGERASGRAAPPSST